MKQNFVLRFDKKEIPIWAEKYSTLTDLEKKIEAEIAPRIRARGYYTREDFLDLCYWKTPRTKKLVYSNTVETIQELTRLALSKPQERLRIEILTHLQGVGWPTASVLLHFGYDNLYPILDFRALWSLGLEKPPSQYGFDFWMDYTHYCRLLAAEINVSMRMLDRALWEYSKQNQK